MCTPDPVHFVTDLIGATSACCHQVVVVTANKLLYWEVISMLLYLEISHEQLENNTWEEDQQNGGHKTRARKRQEGLEQFKKNTARVLVLNLLVSFIDTVEPTQ
jgi:hypothetical protein